MIKIDNSWMVLSWGWLVSYLKFLRFKPSPVGCIKDFSVSIQLSAETTKEKYFLVYTHKRSSFTRLRTPFERWNFFPKQFHVLSKHRTKVYLLLRGSLHANFLIYFLLFAFIILISTLFFLANSNYWHLFNFMYMLLKLLHLLIESLALKFWYILIKL